MDLIRIVEFCAIIFLVTFSVPLFYRAFLLSLFVKGSLIKLISERYIRDLFRVWEESLFSPA